MIDSKMVYSKSDRYIYIYGTPQKKTYVHLTFAGICIILCLFLAAFWTLVFGVPYIFFVRVGCMTCLSTLEGMHSECIQCIQNAFLVKTKIQDSHKTPG